MNLSAFVVELDIHALYRPLRREGLGIAVVSDGDDVAALMDLSVTAVEPAGEGAAGFGDGIAADGVLRAHNFVAAAAGVGASGESATLLVVGQVELFVIYRIKFSACGEEVGGSTLIYQIYISVFQRHARHREHITLAIEPWGGVPSHEVILIVAFLGFGR